MCMIREERQKCLGRRCVAQGKSASRHREMPVTHFQGFRTAMRWLFGDFTSLSYPWDRRPQNTGRWSQFPANISKLRGPKWNSSGFIQIQSLWLETSLPLLPPKPPSLAFAPRCFRPHLFDNRALWLKQKQKQKNHQATYSHFLSFQFPVRGSVPGIFTSLMAKVGVQRS